MSDATPRSEWLIVGKVRRAHGVHGNAVIEVISDFPDRLTKGMEIAIGSDADDPGSAASYAVHSLRWHSKDWLIGLKPRLTREEVQAIRGHWVFLPPLTADDRPAGFHYDHEMIGLKVVDASAEVLGEVKAIEDSPAQRLLAIGRGKQSYLLPWIDTFVRRIDLEAGLIEVDVPPGLLDEDFQ